jgi:hypothetical protein
MGFQNEKDHPEVAPSQFEINYGYGEVVAAADQIQLYKLLTRQVANNMGYTAASCPSRSSASTAAACTPTCPSPRARPTSSGIPKGQEKLSNLRLGVHRPHPHPRARHLPHPQPQRERLSPPRSALRSAQPDQGLGHRSRFDGARAHRQLQVHARRSALGGSGRQPLPGALLASSRPASTAPGREDREPAPGAALPARQHLHAIEDFKSEWMRRFSAPT